MLTPVPQFDGPRVYCGPTAISSVTGVHPYEVLFTVNRLRALKHDAPIVGMDDYEVCNVLGFLGYATKVYVIKPAIIGLKHVTVNRYFENEGSTHPGIVSTTKHYLVSDGVDALCNQTKGQPVPLPAHPYAKAYVKTMIDVWRRIK